MVDAGKTPEGFQLMPTTLNVGLFRAFREPWDEAVSFGDNVKARYQAMLRHQSSQTPQQPEPTAAPCLPEPPDTP